MKTSKPNRFYPLYIVSVLSSGWLVVSSTSIGQTPVDPEDLFATSDQCQACHNNLQASNGDDLSIGTGWRSTIMAHASKDPYWSASVRRETIDHPRAKAAIEDKCATCHMPIARFMNQHIGKQGRALPDIHTESEEDEGPLAATAQDGVSCSVCHQIKADNLGRPESFSGGFIVDTSRAFGRREVFGPYLVAKGTQRIMRSAAGFNPERTDHIQKAEFCATCHTLYTHALDQQGNEVGKLPEQVPYLEWLNSDYADNQSCQDCHMETVSEKTSVSSVLGPLRDSVSKHSFRGGNFFMLKLISRNHQILDSHALPPELGRSVRHTTDHLKFDTASITISEDSNLRDDSLTVIVDVQSTAGHKLPTAYPSRRVWIHLSVEDEQGKTIFESGALKPDGSIAENDNDRKADAYEPHYSVITEPEQVQIYEAIMKTPGGSVTTGLLTAVGYLKDNRLLPEGFDKTEADKDVAVYGAAMADHDFDGGGDILKYAIDAIGIEGPVRVTARLWYQPIGYRWAINLQPYSAKEPRQFIAMYDAIPKRDTAILLSTSSLRLVSEVDESSNGAEGDAPTDTATPQ